MYIHININIYIYICIYIHLCVDHVMYCRGSIKSYHSDLAESPNKT